VNALIKPFSCWKFKASKVFMVWH